MTATAADRKTRPQAILFDWDNTLVDTWPVIHEALNATLLEFGHRAWTMSETRRRVRQSMRDSFPHLFGERWREAAVFFYGRFAAIHLDRLEVRPGAENMLADLKELGLYLGVVSNKKGEYLRREAEHLGWDGYFGGIVGALDARRDKPATDTIDLALAGSNIPRGRTVWFAGDTEIDMECAVKAGCVPVLVRQEGPEPGEFEAFSPVWSVADCQALCNLVRGL